MNIHLFINEFVERKGSNYHQTDQKIKFAEILFHDWAITIQTRNRSSAIVCSIISKKIKNQTAIHK